MERLVVNVEEQLAKRLFDQGFHIEARQAIARARSIRTGTPPHTLKDARLVPLTPEEQAEWEQAAAEDVKRRLREERGLLLAASDWTQLPDVPAKTQKAWAAYRQKLRDLPANTKDPAKVKWPDPPK